MNIKTYTLIFFACSMFVSSLLLSAEPDPVQYIYTPDEIAHEEIECLARNIYFEARNEPTKGKLAVAFVTLNRVHHPEYGDTICEVVHKKDMRYSERKKRIVKVCQFSWVCERKRTIRNLDLYSEIWELSEYVATHYRWIRDQDPTYGALYYHATYVSPKWRKKLVKTKKIGLHIFYTRKSEIGRIY